MARLSATRPHVLLERGAGPDVLPYLQFEDAETRALACAAAGNLGLEAAKESLAHLVSDHSQVTRYEEGLFTTASVAELAKNALAQLSGL